MSGLMLWAVANEQPNTIPFASAAALAKLTRFSSNMTVAGSGLAGSIVSWLAVVCMAVRAAEISGANTSRGSCGKYRASHRSGAGG